MTTPQTTLQTTPQTTPPTLCLNMIVKNESKIILRLLNTVINIIDSWCICDTGSTDDTISIIETFFKEHNKPGKMIHEEFRDFGHNRSVALKACEGMAKADYVLLLDADMMLKIDDQITKNEIKQMLKDDVYYIFQGSDHFFYKNVRIVKNNLGFKYWGVTHEYVQSPEGTIYGTFERQTLFINDIGDGGAKSDKADRDIRLLKKGLEDHPNNDRYLFYLANTYRDKGDHSNAISTYHQRIKVGGWVEEIWQSYYNIGKCYHHLGDNANALYYWLEAYQCFPKRIENLYEIIKHYRNEGKNNLAYHYYLLADYERNQNKTWDFLFLQKDVYDYKIDYELSIIGYYCNRNNHDLKKTCMKVIAHEGVENNLTRNVLSNYKFYAENILQYAIPLSEQKVDLLKQIGKNTLWCGQDFATSTPSLCLDKNDNLIVCVRFVNYRIGDNGEYINQKNITTHNVIAQINIGSPIWKKTDEFLLKYDETHDNVYVGLEDVRLFSLKNKICYNANRGVDDGSNHSMMVEHGNIDLHNKQTIHSVFLKYEKQNNIEKNWVLFSKDQTSLKCVYKWHPLTLGDVVGEKLQITHEIKTPAFFKDIRGSTNGVVVNDEIWFLTHLVSYEDRRYYYHCLVVLNKKTLEMKKYTPLFTFEKNKVEYSLGFVYLKSTNRFLIGYSVMDKETKYMFISKHIFDNMFLSLAGGVAVAGGVAGGV